MASAALKLGAFQKRREFVQFALFVAMIWIAAQIISIGLSDEFAPTRPGAAVLWRPDSAKGLTRLAEQRLLARDPGRAALFARKALRQEPLDVAALAVLGVSLDEAGYPDRAAPVMTLAGQRGWRDAMTQFWLLADGLRERRYQPAFRRADALLKVHGDLAPKILPIIKAEAVSDPDAATALERRLEQSPPWRPGLIELLASDPGPPSQQLLDGVLAALKKSGAPPTEKEVGGIAARLAARGQYAKAHALWTDLVPASSGSLIMNGDFDHEASEGPFSWSLVNGVGWSSSIEPAPGGGGNALRIEYDGLSPPQSVGELLVLPPGSYRLSGRVNFETIGASPVLHWTVSCAQANDALVTVGLAATATGQWLRFAGDFTVPASGCEGQWLKLQATAGDQISNLVAWLDDVSVSPSSPLRAEVR